MITLSVCMIVKNEEAVLARCLDCASQIADEIVIVDTGSTDTTKEIAYRYTDKVYDFEWVNDFAKARNYSFSFAEKEYIMWLDADDIILPEDIQKIKDLKQRLTSDIDIVMMKYHVGFDAVLVDIPTVTIKRSRIIRKDKQPKAVWQEPIHEYLPIIGNMVYEDIAICHKKLVVADPARNLKILQTIAESEDGLNQRNKYYYARELKDNGYIDQAIAVYEEFISDDIKPYSEDYIVACNDLSGLYAQTKQEEKMLPVLFKSFCCGLPRGETCYNIGKYYLNMQQYDMAIFYFKLVFTLDKSVANSFFYADLWGYSPALDLTVCYDKLGDLKMAEYYNSLAKTYRPESEAVKYNEKYFRKRKDELLEKEKIEEKYKKLKNLTQEEKNEFYIENNKNIEANKKRIQELIK